MYLHTKKARNLLTIQEGLDLDNGHTWAGWDLNVMDFIHRQWSRRYGGQLNGDVRVLRVWVVEVTRMAVLTAEGAHVKRGGRLDNRKILLCDRDQLKGTRFSAILYCILRMYENNDK